MTDLRNHLFDTIERLKDPDKDHPMNIDTAKAICDVATKVLDTVEIEIRLRQVVAQLPEMVADLRSNEFLELGESDNNLPPKTLPRAVSK